MENLLMPEKILFVAHPDDEILWFAPDYFDRIYMVFLHREDKPWFRLARLEALSYHPLHDRIYVLDLEEPGYWKDASRYQHYLVAKEKLCHELIMIRDLAQHAEIFTHNTYGEYGHVDHQLTFECVHQVFQHTHKIWTPAKCWLPVSSIEQEIKPQKSLPINLMLFREIRMIYHRFKVWTWNLYFEPNEFERFQSVGPLT